MTEELIIIDEDSLRAAADRFSTIHNSPIVDQQKTSDNHWLVQLKNGKKIEYRRYIYQKDDEGITGTRYTVRQLRDTPGDTSYAHELGFLLFDNYHDAYVVSDLLVGMSMHLRGFVDYCAFVPVKIN